MMATDDPSRKEGKMILRLLASKALIAFKEVRLRVRK